ncbi:MAG: c-di-GMP phosphodiesterase, partial [Acidimicrobiaceae bacterium]
DRSFISEIGDSDDAANVVRDLVQLGKSLGLETVAEGIENTQQLTRLRGQDCDTGQGYLHSRPLPPDELIATFGAACRVDRVLAT